MIGSILSKVLGRGGGGARPAGGTGMGAGTTGTRGSSTDAAIGKGVRGILSRFTRR